MTSSAGQSGNATPPTTYSASNQSKSQADTSQCKNTQTYCASTSTASPHSTHKRGRNFYAPAAVAQITAAHEEAARADSTGAQRRGRPALRSPHAERHPTGPARGATRVARHERRRFGLERRRVGGNPTRRRVSALLAERAAQASPRATAGLPEPASVPYRKPQQPCSDEVDWPGDRVQGLST